MKTENKNFKPIWDNKFELITGYTETTMFNDDELKMGGVSQRYVSVDEMGQEKWLQDMISIYETKLMDHKFGVECCERRIKELRAKLEEEVK